MPLSLGRPDAGCLLWSLVAHMAGKRHVCATQRSIGGPAKPVRIGPDSCETSEDQTVSNTALDLDLWAAFSGAKNYRFSQQPCGLFRRNGVGIEACAPFKACNLGGGKCEVKSFYSRKQSGNFTLVAT